MNALKQRSSRTFGGKFAHTFNVRAEIDDISTGRNEMQILSKIILQRLERSHQTDKPHDCQSENIRSEEHGHCNQDETHLSLIDE